MPARNAVSSPDELVTVAYIAEDGTRYPNVKLPRRLVSGGSRRAKENHLRATGQLPSETPLPEMQEPAEVVQQVADDGRLSALERRIGAVESRPQANTPDAASLERLAISVQRAAISKEEIVGVADAAVDKVQTIAGECDSRLSNVEAREQAMISTVSEAVSEGQEATAAAIQSLEQRSAAALSDIEQQALTAAQEIARRQRGPQGLAGAGVVIAPEDPSKTDDESFGARWFGRELVEGDGVLQASANGITIWRRAGGAWLKSSELNPRTELVNQSLQVQDSSTVVNATLPPQNQQQGEGSSPDTILTRTMGQRTNLRLAGLDRFDAAGFNDLADSALVSIELTALDGTRAGENGTWLISIAQRTNGICEQQIYACLGPLADAGMAPDIDIRSVGAYTQPAGVTGVFPPSGTKHLVCSGWAEDASGLPGRPNQVAIKGWCKWNFDSRVIQATPAWKLSDEL